MTGDLGDRIRQARKYLGMSASDAAHRAGLTRKSWERYELGKAEPKASSLGMLASCGIDANWLLTGYGHMLPAPLTITPILPNNPAPQAIAPDLLHIVMEELEIFRARENPGWDSKQAAKVMVLGYRLLESDRQNGQPANRDKLHLLMQAARL